MYNGGVTKSSNSSDASSSSTSKVKGKADSTSSGSNVVETNTGSTGETSDSAKVDNSTGNVIASSGDGESEKEPLPRSSFEKRDACTQTQFQTKISEVSYGIDAYIYREWEYPPTQLVFVSSFPTFVIGATILNFTSYVAI